jgi:hypothetical protein
MNFGKGMISSSGPGAAAAPLPVGETGGSKGKGGGRGGTPHQLARGKFVSGPVTPIPLTIDTQLEVDVLSS